MGVFEKRQTVVHPDKLHMMQTIASRFQDVCNGGKGVTLAPGEGEHWEISSAPFPVHCFQSILTYSIDYATPDAGEHDLLRRHGMFLSHMIRGFVVITTDMLGNSAGA